ncbi:phosphotriesterase [Solihabitans fulvus]|uniref:Phosphotriesterase n=1 Tax=Solihabitans fulvus TaxID=1892852 RepID=A0A5B2X3T9_9PSEU|nr:phosphotriesterase [Solihabitans fulvus]KAA2257916.1 phosphotriesterase [Solihabitans fulvus]
MTAVRTVLGDLAGADLGVTNSHDHLFFRSALLPGQELDDVAAAEAELRGFADLGGRTVVQWTPFGLGRRAEALPELSRATGVTVVAATGLHRAAHYAPGLVDRVRDRLADLFVGELTKGVLAGDDPDGAVLPFRAGLIKIAGAFHDLDAHARHVLVAAAEAHHSTGAPISVHLEHGTAPLDVLHVLHDSLGVPPQRIILGHLNRSPDLMVHRQVADTGAWLAFDGPSRANHATDWRLPESLVALVAAGHGGQVLLGGDTTTAQARAATGGGPGMRFLLTTLRPRLGHDLGEDQVTRFLVDNPARAFAVDWR